jgi:hypothetical protein
MSNVILSNTSGQIDFTLRESYARLTGAFVGPSGNGGNGFMIQDGAKNSGIFVSNSCIDFYKNIVNFKQASNVNFIIPSTTCFSVSGNNSSFLFNQEGTIAFGSGINSNYKGVQAYSTNPSLTLINSNANCNQAIRFLNSAGAEIFNICQIDGAGARFSGMCLGFFTSAGPLIRLSGNNITFNAPVNPNFTYFFSGSSYFSGDSYLRGNTTGSGIFCYFNSDTNNIGFNVDTCSYFCKNITLSGGLCITGTGNTSFLCSDNYICSRTGYFNCISGSVSDYTTSTNEILCIKNYGSITSLNGLNFTGNKTAFLSGICTSGICISSGYFNSHLPNGLNVISGNLNLTGALRIHANPLAPIPNFISGCSFQLISTSTATVWPNSISGDLSISGCLSGTGVGYFNNFCAFNSSATSCFRGPLCAATNVCTPLVCSTDIRGNNICANLLVTGACGCFNCFQQLNGDQISCFCSSGLNIGLNQSGYVAAINTSKAWGIIRMTDGSVSLQSGYNLLSTQTYTTLSSSLNYSHAYGICFCKPIVYPFIVNFNVYGNTNNSLISCINGSTTSFTGNSLSCLLVGSATFTTSPYEVELYTSGRCSNNNICPYTANSTYSEIFYNFRNCRGPSTILSELLKTSADAIVHFNILGL